MDDMDDFVLAAETNRVKGWSLYQSVCSLNPTKMRQWTDRQTENHKKKWGTFGLWDKQWSQDTSKLIIVSFVVSMAEKKNAKARLEGT